MRPWAIIKDKTFGWDVLKIYLETCFSLHWRCRTKCFRKLHFIRKLRFENNNTLFSFGHFKKYDPVNRSRSSVCLHWRPSTIQCHNNGRYTTDHKFIITLTSWWARWRLISSVSRLYNRLFRHRSKKPQSSALLALCERNPPETGGFPSQRASNADFFFHLVTSSWHASSKLF